MFRVISYILCLTVYIQAIEQITQKMILSGKKPAELNFEIKVKYKTLSKAQGCKTKSKSGMFLVPLKKSKTYAVNSIESDYSIDIPLKWQTVSKCKWKISAVEIKMHHMTMQKSRGITGFLFNDLNKNGRSFLGSTTIYCKRKYIEQDGSESKGISCRDQNAGDQWVYYFNGFLNEEVLKYKIDIVFGELEDAAAAE